MTSIDSKGQANYASLSFVLSGMLAVGASLTTPYLITCIALCVAVSAFFTIGCYCLYKANTILIDLTKDGLQLYKSTE